MKAKYILLIIIAVSSVIMNVILYNVVIGKEAIINKQCQKIKQLQQVDESKVSYQVETYYRLK